MRFNVVSLAFALAAPAMGAAVGFERGGNGVVQEVETTPAAAKPSPLVPIVGSGGVVMAPDGPASTSTSANAVATSIPVFGGQQTSAKPVISTPVVGGPQTSAKPVTSTPVVGGPQTSAKPVTSTPLVGGQQTTAKALTTSPAGVGKPTPTPTPSPSTGGSTGGNVPEGTNGQQILIIENKYGSGLSIVSGNSGGGAPSNVKSQMANGETQTITLPAGWSGRFAANPTGVPAGNQDGTKIEGTNSGPGYWDISLVDGYTVPITCTCGAATTPFIGCNIDLFKQGAKCPKSSGSDALCLNPDLRLDHKLDKGPADPWFAACKDTAYTYPQNDIATQPCAKTLTCCIGTSCAPVPGQQGKRELSPVAKRWAFKREDIIEAK